MADTLKSIQAIVKKYGQEAIYRLGDEKIVSVPVIPTGSLALDVALGVGGFPRGRLTVLFGTEGSAKTSLCLHAAAMCQEMGGQAAFVDVEHALDTEWAIKCGVHIDDLYVAQPQHGEQAIDIVEDLLADFDVVILDSVAALVPKAELEGDMEDAHMGVQARLMGKAMRKLAGVIKSSHACVLFTNQLRSSMAMWGSPEVQSGGKALPYFASVMVDLRRKEQIKEGDEVVGNTFKATVKKNKVAPPFKVAEFEVYYDEGISRTSELIQYGIAGGIIEKGGAGWFTLKSNGEPRKIQGMAALRRAFAEDAPLRIGIENSIRQQYGLPLRG